MTITALLCPRQAPRETSYPATLRPDAPQPALPQPLSSIPFPRRCHRRPCQQLTATRHGCTSFPTSTRRASHSPANTTRNRQCPAATYSRDVATSTNGRSASPGGARTATQPDPASLPSLGRRGGSMQQPSHRPARIQPTDKHHLAAPVARSAAGAILATTLALFTALGPAECAAIAAAPEAALSSSLLSLSSGSRTALLEGAPAPEANAPAVAPQSPPPPGSQAFRFTTPEVLDQLPPLPSEFPPLPELRLPPYTTAKLRNGLRVFLLPDAEVPLVRASLLMRGGQYASPPDKVGLASLTAWVQRAGGSTAHPAAALDARLEDLAASLEVGAGPQAVSADLQCLAGDVEEVVGLMAELVREPLLPADKLALFQAQVINALDHQNDSPATVARRKITQLAYGTDSVYARSPTRAGVTSVTPADLAAYVAAWERPDAAVLGVVGDFEPRRMMQVLEREFGDWAPAPGQPAAPPPVPRGAPPALPPPASDTSASSGTSPSDGRPVVYLVDRPGLTQANVVVAEPGISLSDPDVFALDVLGGAFNSFGGQLFDTLRSREGLAYSVYGSWDSPADHPGLFTAGGQTSSPGEFLRSLRQLLARAASEPPPESELTAAREETLNSFAFNFASTASQMQRILVYDLIGLPQNFLFEYIRGVEAVTRADVAAAAAAHLHPERQAVVVVADREVARPSLEAAGFEVRPMRLED